MAADPLPRTAVALLGELLAHLSRTLVYRYALQLPDAASLPLASGRAVHAGIAALLRTH